MKLPAYMTHSDCRRWLLWKSVPQENSKPKKIPYYINGKKRYGELDRPDDLAQLVSFDEAWVALQKGEYTGLAFALGADGLGGYWQGIDLDNISNKPELLNLITSLPGYVETSPSKNGVHVIGYGCHFQPLGSNKSGIEAYSSSRYFTVTGDNALYPISNEVEDLANFIAQNLKPLHTSNKQLTKTHNSELNTINEDDSLINRLRDALNYILSDDYDVWIAIGHALKTLGTVGRELWSEWSMKSTKFKGESDLQRWETFKGDYTNYHAIFAKAGRNGWNDPYSQATSGRINDFEQSINLSKNTQLWMDISIGDILTNPSSPPLFIVESLLPANVVTLLTAHGGTGKSMLALQLSICVAMDLAFMNRRTISCKVLFFSGEDSTPVIRHRLACICRELGVDPEALSERLLVIDSTENPGLYVTSKNQISIDGYEALYERCTNYGAELIVIDNASDTFDANENERARVREFIRFLTKLAKSQNAALLLLAHMDKDSVKYGSTENYSGSTAWHNSVRSRLFLSIDKETKLLSLTQQKSNLGKISNEITMRRGDDGILHFITLNEEDAERTILALIEKYYELDIWISPAPTSRSNPYKILKEDSDFPQINRKQLGDMIQSLLKKNELIIEIYQTKHRKEKERYRSARTAPTEILDVGAASPIASPCSAPSTTGGEGEDRAEMVRLFMEKLGLMSY